MRGLACVDWRSINYISKKGQIGAEESLTSPSWLGLRIYDRARVGVLTRP